MTHERNIPDAAREDKSVFVRACAYLSAGLSLIPIKPDGTKGPYSALLPYDSLLQRHVWKPYQSQKPSHEDLISWFVPATGAGIGILGGAISGNLEIIDFDHFDLYDLWCALVKDVAPGLLEKLTLLIATPRPGRHVPYRCERIEGNQELALDEQENVLIETRGDGGYIVAAGSPLACHPSGRPYEVIKGSWEQIPVITPDERDILLGLARSFNRAPQKTDDAPRASVASHQANGDRPGDAFNLRVSWAEVLTPAGWTHEGTCGQADYWKRPGKTKPGHSAITGNGDDRLCVFSSNAAPFEKYGVSKKTYSKFQAYALLYHGNDFTAAAKALAADARGRRNGQPHDDAGDEHNTPEVRDHQPQPPTPEPDEWKADLSTTKGGEVKETLGNVSLALQHIEPWASHCWYDVVRDLCMVGDQELDDIMVIRAGLAIEEHTGMPVRSKRLVEIALNYRCHAHSKDLLREWLESLAPWDGVPRLRSWLQTYAHAPKGAYSQDVSRLILEGMVARALDPGCQYRHVAILEGPENTGKTKLVRALATPEWYRELSHGLDGKEAHMRIKRAWVAELAELSSFPKTEEARLKSFFTLNEDAYIPKFSNFEVVHKRRTVFIGTVNPEGDNTYLRGQTGNTRYLPIPVYDINLKGFEAVRDQLFAEALQHYRAHAADWWMLSSAGEAVAQEAREERRQRSVYEDDLASWLERTKKDMTWVEEIMKDYLVLPKAQWADRRIQMEITKALKAIGWEKGKRERRDCGDKELIYPWRPGSDWRTEP